MSTVALLRSAGPDAGRLIRFLAGVHRVAVVDASDGDRAVAALRRIGPATVVAAGGDAPVALDAAVAVPEAVDQLVLFEPQPVGDWPDRYREVRVPVLTVVGSGRPPERTRGAYVVATLCPAAMLIRLDLVGDDLFVTDPLTVGRTVLGLLPGNR